jgi:hypothetical protein
MTPHKITEFYEEWFSVCLNITSKFRNIAIFKIFVVKENDYANVTCIMCVAITVPNFICQSTTVQEFSS